MVITITSPGYKYTSEMSRQVSSDVKTSASKLTENAPSLKEFQKILAEKMNDNSLSSGSSNSVVSGTNNSSSALASISSSGSTSSALSSTSTAGSTSSALSSTSTAGSTSSASKSGSSSVDTGLGFSVPSSLESIFQKAAKKYGVDVKILETIGYNESRFQATATSSSGAQGIMQLMPSTAKSYGVTNAYDPEQNIMAGAHIISDKLKEFNGNLDLAIGAYACGSGAIHRNGDKLTTAAKYYVAKFRKYYN